MAEKVPSTSSRSSSASSTSSTGSSIRSWRQRPQPPRIDPPKLSARVAECAGGTAAECAAVCCCCPCGLAGLLLCALVKLPAGLCRLAIRKRRRKRRRNPTLLAPSVEERFGIKRRDRWVVPATAAAPSPEIEKMEREMWARFYGAGFWRSPSQREDR